MTGNLNITAIMEHVGMIVTNLSIEGNIIIQKIYFKENCI